MNAVGIEIGKNFWTVTHLEAAILGLKLKGYFTIDTGTDSEKAAIVKKFITEAGITDARITIGFDRFNSITKVLSLPAPDRDSVEGMLKFEIEKHIPFSIDDANYDFQIIESKKGVQIVTAAAIKKEVTEKILDVFRGTGLKVDSVITDKLALHNALHYLKKLPKDRSLIFMHVNDDLIVIETYGAGIPIDSRSIKRRDRGDWIKAVIRELKFAELSAKAQTGKIPSQIIFSSEAPIDESIISALKSDIETPLIVDSFKLPDGSAVKNPVSFGLALRSLEKGPLRLNIFKGLVKKDSATVPLFNIKYAAIALVFALVTGASYLIQDRLVLARLDSAIEAVGVKGDDLNGLRKRFKTIEERITVLEGTDYKGLQSLNILNGLAANMPKGTWITGFDFSESEISIEGYSEQASGLLISLEQSGIVKEVEFSGPVTKISDGKERFRLKAKKKADGGRA